MAVAVAGAVSTKLSSSELEVSWRTGTVIDDRSADRLGAVEVARREREAIAIIGKKKQRKRSMNVVKTMREYRRTNGSFNTLKFLLCKG